MCVTYKIDISEKEMQEVVDAAQRRVDGMLVQSGDIYPKAIVPVFCAHDRHIEVLPMMWGFPLEGKKTVNFNARAETMNKIRMFARSKPVIIPATGFYEWRHEEQERQKFLFRSPKGPLTYIAGLWDDFSDREDGLFPVRFTMLTTRPSPSFRVYHDREPAVLDRRSAYSWLESRNPDLVRSAPFDLDATAV